MAIKLYQRLVVINCFEILKAGLEMRLAQHHHLRQIAFTKRLVKQIDRYSLFLEFKSIISRNYDSNWIFISGMLRSPCQLDNIESKSYHFGYNWNWNNWTFTHILHLLSVQINRQISCDETLNCLNWFFFFHFHTNEHFYCYLNNFSKFLFKVLNDNVPVSRLRKIRSSFEFNVSLFCR